MPQPNNVLNHEERLKARTIVSGKYAHSYLTLGDNEVFIEELSCASKILMYYFLSQAEHEYDNGIFAAVPRIYEETGYNRHNYYPCYHELIDTGYMCIQHRFNTSNAFIFPKHAPMLAQAEKTIRIPRKLLLDKRLTIQERFLIILTAVLYQDYDKEYIKTLLNTNENKYQSMKKHLTELKYLSFDEMDKPSFCSINKDVRIASAKEKLAKGEDNGV